MWIALALYAAGEFFAEPSWLRLAADVFTRLASGQRPDGSFLAPDPSSGPETQGYDELVVLHAAASYAAQSADAGLKSAVLRAAEYHQNETQPDHATAQPWAVFAFVWNPTTRPTADQILHAATVQHPRGLDGFSLMLLGDALYCLTTLAGRVDRPR